MSIYNQVNNPVLRRPVEPRQYTSVAFGKTLRDSGRIASTGRRGDAEDNAACERLISTVKSELIKRRSWTSRDQARRAVFTYIETFYNHGRCVRRRGLAALGGTRRVVAHAALRALVQPPRA
jgi:transposase InsO family protein